MSNFELSGPESTIPRKPLTATHRASSLRAPSTQDTAKERPKPRLVKKVPSRPRGKRNKRSKAALWRSTTGDHGHSVTVFEKRGKRNLYIEWWSPNKSRVERHSLGHADKERALQRAREMSDQIRLRTQPVVGGAGEPRLDVLLHLYYEEHGKKLGGHQPAEHERRRRLWTSFFQQQSRPIVYPRDLDRALFETFIHVRRHGDLDVEGIALPEAAPEPSRKGEKREAVVRDGTIDGDLIYLIGALNWATKYKVDGQALLKSRPTVPRCKPHAGTLRQPVAAEDDLEALRKVLDSVDPQKLLRFWMELVNQFGWRVTGLASVKASDIDFTPRPHAPHGRLLKNATIDKERRHNDSVPLTERIAELLRELLELRKLKAGDDAYLFVAPKSGGTNPWSRWHIGRLLERAERAAGIAHIGGLHAWRRKWHTERKNYPAQDVAAAAGYADVSSVERYRHADPETTFQVISNPTVVIRRAPQQQVVAQNQAAGAVRAVDDRQTGTSRKLRRRSTSTEPTAADLAAPAEGVGQGHGSAAKSVMPDGTVVDSRDQRFAANLAVAREYATENGHLLPKKHERPGGVNLLMWLKNQEIRILNGTMPLDRRLELEQLAAWRERATGRNITLNGALRSQSDAEHESTSRR